MLFNLDLPEREKDSSKIIISTIKCKTKSTSAVKHMKMLRAALEMVQLWLG